MKNKENREKCECKGTGIVLINGVEHSCPVCMEKKDNAPEK